MASGRPLVATDIYSHTQVLSEDSAFLALPEAQDFSEKLLLALREDSSSRVSCAASLVNEKYSREAFNRRVLELYGKLCES